MTLKDWYPWLEFPHDYFWLPLDAMPIPLRAVGISKADALYLPVRWCVVWLYVWRTLGELLDMLGAWVTCELARGRGWRKRVARQLTLWEWGRVA